MSAATQATKTEAQNTTEVTGERKEMCISGDTQLGREWSHFY